MTATETARAPDMSIVWRYAASSVLGIVPYGMLMPLIAVALDSRGHTATAVGFVGLLVFAGVFVLSPIAPRLRARYGTIAVHRAGMVLWSAGIAGILIDDGYLWWCAMHLLIGVSAALLWGVAESLIAEHAPADRLGRITGLYQTLIGAAVAVGPFVSAAFALDIAAAAPVALALMALSWIPVLLIRARHVPAVSGTASLLRWRTVVATSPALVAGAMLGGIFETGINALGAVHALGIGLGGAAATAVPGAIATGSLLAQYPAGWIADRVPVIRLLVAAAAILAASGAVLLAAPAWPWLMWPVAVVWGAVGGALYTLVMIRVGIVFRGSDVVTATALAISAYTLGVMIGPLIAGPAMDASRLYGLAAALVLLAAASLVPMRIEARRP
ncbi:MAG: MFS transporter [Alphaproteobacteria bacterium]|nr:MFS transporter [Alphaproteobacteria bacterium]